MVPTLRRSRKSDMYANNYMRVIKKRERNELGPNWFVDISKSHL